MDGDEEGDTIEAERGPPAGKCLRSSPRRNTETKSFTIQLFWTAR